MRITIAGRHMEMTDALKRHAEKNLEKLKTHFDRVIDAHVVLSVEKHRHIAEITLHANGVRIHGREASTDMYSSIDAVIEKLDKQIRKHKDRIRNYAPRKIAEVGDYEHHIIERVEDTPSAATATATATATQHRVVRREKLALKPMNLDEATLQLELTDDKFLVFSNAETQRVNVLYARDDGTYGLIEPEL